MGGGLTGTEKSDLTRIDFLVRQVESVVQNGTAPAGLHGVSLTRDSLQALPTYLKENIMIFFLLYCREQNT